MKGRIIEILGGYGLDNKEIKVYLCLVEKIELNAYVLSKITGIHRSTVYEVIERLISKGFIYKIEKENKIFYSALDINQVIVKVKEKEALLYSLIPELENIKETGVSRVRVLESKDSQNQFSFDLYWKIKKGVVKEICVIDAGPSIGTDSGVSSEIFLESMVNEIKKNKINKKVNIKIIWDKNFKNSKTLSSFSGLGEERFLENMPRHATTIIGEDFVAYMFTMNGKPQVIEIQNKLIAKEIRFCFGVMWEMSKDAKL